MFKRSCFFCRHATIEPGYSGSYYSPPEPPAAYCEGEIGDKVYQLYPLDIDLGATEEELGGKCIFFEPTMIDQCSQCGKPMNVPYYAWLIWANCWDMEPVCSFECKEKREKKFLELIGREAEYDRA